MYEIPFLNLKGINQRDHEEIRNKIDCVLESGRYLLGDELVLFEKSFASFSQVKKCIGVASGLDALVLILKALNLPPGSDVIVPANTFIASALAVSNCGLTPVPVDPSYDSMLLNAKDVENSITENTSAIMPVHLYGHMCDMDAINALAKRYDLKVIEDAAQAHGAVRNNIAPGMSAPAAFSFYPGKNLGAMGDGGAVVTNDETMSDKLQLYRNYGSKVKYVHAVKGVNSRLDEIQAAILTIKLQRLSADNKRRRYIANNYLTNINNALIDLPVSANSSTPVWHLFVIKSEKREKLISYLADNGIEALIHYPTPIHMHECYKELTGANCPVSEKLSKNILSLPISPVMSDGHVSKIIEVLNKWRQ